MDTTIGAWIKQTEEILKHYHHPDKLEQHPAAFWPAVQELIDQGLASSIAIRQILNQALAAMQKDHPKGAALLRERYVRGRSIEIIADEEHRDPSLLHRRRRSLIKELAVLIAEYNRKTERRTRFERFTVRQPVFGLEQIVEKLVLELRNQIAPGVMILEGMGGLGKTTLAKLIAYHFVDDDSFVRVLWVSAKQIDFDFWGGRQRTLHLTPINPHDIVDQLAKELDIETSGNVTDMQTEVLARCQRHAYLIILDNLETVADMAALAPLIEQLVGPSRILITTRDRALDAFPPDLARHYVSLSELDASTSYELLRSAAKYTNAPVLAEASIVDLAKIYTVTGGNPLALWLVAGQAHGVPWSVFIRDLVEHSPQGSKGYELYDYLYRRSWELLSPSARMVLFAMHRFETGVEYELLHKLSKLDRLSFDGAVEELANRMLLQFDGAYYNIHRLTYTFLRAGIVGWWE
jgi:hypothetical protein